MNVSPEREVICVYCVCKGNGKLIIEIMNSAALKVACPQLHVYFLNVC